MKKTILDYMKLTYPVSLIRHENGYEVWHPDFGSGTIAGFGTTIEEAIIPELNNLKLNYKIAKLEIRTKDFFCKICELIQQSKYFIANLTNPTFNVGLELGLALGLDKDIILIASSRTKLPSDLVRQEVIFYNKDI